jgi:hypothetical protein
VSMHGASRGTGDQRPPGRQQTIGAVTGVFPNGIA